MSKSQITHFAGKVAEHLPQWKRISSDPWLLKTIKGVDIPFVEQPCQEKEPRPYKLGDKEVDFVTQEVERMLQRGIIEEVEEIQGQVISNVFLRPKKDGGFRMILDLTWVNEHVSYEHFKMHSLTTALEMMRPGCWMGSIDLKDAYYSIPVRKSQRKFLSFRWEDRLFQFTVLPNGLACAPRVFTKILNPVFAHLREQGIECFQYIDDTFVVADTEEKCRKSLATLVGTLEGLGFKIHDTKSVFEPSGRLTFLGFILDSKEMKVFLTKEKEEKFLRAARDLTKKIFPTIREVAGLIGLAIAYSQAFTYGDAHVKFLEMDKIKALSQSKGNFDAPMRLSHKAQEEVLWWMENIESSGKDILEKQEDIVMYADASNDGWGAHVGPKATGGRWSREEQEDHINVLELKAILLGLQSLCQTNSVVIKVFTDNTTALAYVKHMGGVKSERCNEVAQEIWEWCEDRNIRLTVAHIPGVENTLADFKSRHFADNLEWTLSEKNFDRVVESFGQPEIDLFATRLNNKVEKYVSWSPDPGAVAIDAFTVNWSSKFFYAFPPFRCVGRVIQKILQEGAQGILIVPWWPTQPWWGRLVDLNLPHIRFRKRKNNLIPQGRPDNVPLLHKSPLGAFRF